MKRFLLFTFFIYSISVFAQLTDFSPYINGIKYFENCNYENAKKELFTFKGTPPEKDKFNNLKDASQNWIYADNYFKNKTQDNWQKALEIFKDIQSVRTKFGMREDEDISNKISEIEKYLNPPKETKSQVKEQRKDSDKPEISNVVEKKEDKSGTTNSINMTGNGNIATRDNFGVINIVQMPISETSSSADLPQKTEDTTSHSKGNKEAPDKISSCLPFGIPQFYYNKTRDGVIFAGLQGVFIAGSIYCFAECLENNRYANTEQDDGKRKSYLNYRNNYMTGGFVCLAGFSATYIANIICSKKDKKANLAVSPYFSPESTGLSLVINF